ncbi:2-aminoethylphosphonate ABC transporter substrate-binding protein [Arthrobacter sp. H35-D1]|uniref:2-aminoethylphosphonate ABC transporter substrate-binding protein n=1 Tax=Arthrobacter sp. H35-D1 TaxID=3046202 RepID=UPI0024B8F29B|nr:2-aminoethylphosphonate ABC transporter substrate-binding protein [Arthrobacter sp. H35-D1]MDJ0312094.1 2-aminoethylphosphonate ABC transporter substrate-binding protein [Arthrobacter sp. H35-D1]
MKKPFRLASLLAATTAGAILMTGCGGTATSADNNGAEQQITVYSADGLADWYGTTFAGFTKDTGIKVNVIEAGSGEVVSRAEKEKSNPQADLIITLPPFIQQAQKNGLLQKNAADVSGIPAEAQSKDGMYVSVVNNYAAMIRNTSAPDKPDTWAELLDAKYQGKIQYSTPGQAGDGTAVLLLLQHLKGKDGALSYLKDLQKNNVGPSASTGKLGPKVSKGELSVANSDVQMALQSIKADKSGFEVFFPKNDDGSRVTLALPYVMGLAANAPHQDNATKLMSYLLSKPVQETISSSALGLPVRSDVTPTDENYTALKKTMDGVTIWQPVWDHVLSNLDADLKAYNTATGQ